MMSLTHALARPLFLLLSCLGPALAQAGWLPFAATVDGTSQIVAVIDPNKPVVRVETMASGTSLFGALSYFSTDLIDLSSGQGAGSNRFVSAGGDELFGSFNVQLIPSTDASLFDLLGELVFTGGTGQFQGAGGAADFSGRGQFVSASLALTHFEFVGRLNTVPEPSSGLLVAVAVCAAAALRRRRA